ncbi:pfs [Verticillium alfalfae VaMs.102]|uniref:Pfs n=1 Tax=Verticillium alfalfae (strain VaMs.102 / ATCC MYA-4576 / FGSC 10136) TaxID=526221 RepID=C9SGL4_VERA1|nr:pfs [Verticillium alfalfae VaMs.102]EEY17531.1 pfs [Verticillium alfalfae VaMs.102]
MNTPQQHHEDPGSRSPSFPILQGAIPYHRFTIAWVCALHIERAAALAMLDETFESAPVLVPSLDVNTYTLGRIAQQYIVIACLPESQYGTNNAAIVLTNLTRTFSSVRMALMVGVGGGVPGRTDMRLGDVVVGTRVMQYDMGKISDRGLLQRTAVARVIHPLLGTAVSSLRSDHELQPGRLLQILRNGLRKLPQYCQPSTPDRLFLTTYQHELSEDSCDTCDETKLVIRIKRPSEDFVIHYGAIASGNQVMKNSTARDEIARELDVVCFEMEAAGLMDVLPCLPIRGICDYSDSHKSKEWQKYAAATAAAYARAFVETLRVTSLQESVSRDYASRAQGQ